MEDNSVETYVHVLPELKLPKAGGKVTKTEEVHPFWFIKRTDKDESVANMEMVFDDWTQVVASPLKALVKANAKVIPATYTSSVSLPCLVNTVPIMAGEEVILKWKAKPAQKRKDDQPEKTAFDQIARQEKKRVRGNAKAQGNAIKHTVVG